MFTAQDVKNLREKTGAGMLDCKKALDETKGNIEEAINWLREKGISKALKKAERIAAEGLSEAVSNDTNAVIIEVNCETDFVARNEEFKTLINTIANAILNNEVKTMEDANKLVVDNETIEEKIVAFTAKIGEKISFRRFEKLAKTESQEFGIYSHMGGKITSVVVIEGNNHEVAKDIAMHVAAMNPSYLVSSDIPEDVLNKEREIIKEQSMNEGKPAEIAEKMVEGRIRKFFKEVCLVEQEFIKDPSLSVGNYAKNNNCSIVKMVRYEVGEGIEKRNDDFATEVMNQING
ncbi:MAG TPA: translation elongation factor Ts [Bacilli bacterium]|jgi:translation elongation factor Ts|nr:MAG: translation elongation factor Ts [Mycoplasma sp. CAG:611_25_7]CDA23504.1 elongation factor Ts [Mycoplasma sp. CAG:611]HJJ08102.1 translation elongation factor Ts [Bacilli bacterium]